MVRQWSSRKVILTVVLGALLLIVVYRNSTYLGSTALTMTGSISSSKAANGGGDGGSPDSIPRIVHLVHLKPNEAVPLHFSFQFFLCVYSALLYIEPTTLFIHTNFNATEIAVAAQYGSVWTRKVLTAFPDLVTLNTVEAPTFTFPGGLPLARIEHKSDFVRMEQVALHGGIYLDADVLTLRSPAPLLQAGFRAVVGRQGDGNINNGCFLATRDAALVALMRRDMPLVFSGEWQQHSIALITPLAERLVYVPHEVLILDTKAFAPTGWWDESAFALFAEAPGEGEAVGTINQANVETVDPYERWINRTRGRDWEMDFSATYFLHAFKAMWGPVPNFQGISVPYVLRRRSNYAVAAWPVVIKGIQDGIIDEGEESL